MEEKVSDAPEENSKKCDQLVNLTMSSANADEVRAAALIESG